MESFLKVIASVPEVVSGKKNAATRIQIVNHCIIWSILCKISHFWDIVNIACMGGDTRVSKDMCCVALKDENM